jgi:hypothetical protein
VKQQKPGAGAERREWNDRKEYRSRGEAQNGVIPLSRVIEGCAPYIRRHRTACDDGRRSGDAKPCGVQALVARDPVEVLPHRDWIAHGHIYAERRIDGVTYQGCAKVEIPHEPALCEAVNQRLNGISEHG